MNSIKLPFTSEMRGGGKKSSFKIMTSEQLDKKINNYIKTGLKSGSLVNYVKHIFLKNNTNSNLNSLNIKRTKKISNNSNLNKIKLNSINYVKASKTKDYYKNLSKTKVKK
jgi:hypothetical protein